MAGRLRTYRFRSGNRTLATARALRQTPTDLPALQRLIDDRAFNKTQTYELESLGVAFGDVSSSELPVRW